MATNRFSQYDDFEKYEAFEDEFDPIKSDRQGRKHRKPKVVPPNIYTKSREIQDVIDPSTLEGVRMTYVPSKHEGGWLTSSLKDFFEQRLITDVVAAVKGGKEASVYRCLADKSVEDAEFLAAKVYRPQMFRSLTNDAMYKQGRSIKTADAHDVKANNHRVMRAVGKKSAFGRQVSHTSWLMYEYTMMEKLYADGGSVPRPYAANDNAILMSFIGDENMAAPPLGSVRLGRDEAHHLFEEVMRNMRLLLDHGYVHGDLSAFNILYFEGKITLIDFPQVADVDANSQAQFILQRDVTRVCEYFTRQGVKCDDRKIAADLWDHYGEAQRRRLFDMSFDDEGNFLE